MDRRAETPPQQIGQGVVLDDRSLAGLAHATPAKGLVPKLAALTAALTAAVRTIRS